MCINYHLHYFIVFGYKPILLRWHEAVLSFRQNKIEIESFHHHARDSVATVADI